MSCFKQKYWLRKCILAMFKVLKTFFNTPPPPPVTSTRIKPDMKSESLRDEYKTWSLIYMLIFESQKGHSRAWREAARIPPVEKKSLLWDAELSLECQLTKSPAGHIISRQSSKLLSIKVNQTGNTGPILFQTRYPPEG